MQDHVMYRTSGLGLRASGCQQHQTCLRNWSWEILTAAVNFASGLHGGWLSHFDAVHAKDVKMVGATYWQNKHDDAIPSRGAPTL